VHDESVALDPFAGSDRGAYMAKPCRTAKGVKGCFSWYPPVAAVGVDFGVGNESKERTRRAVNDHCLRFDDGERRGDLAKPAQRSERFFEVIKDSEKEHEFVCA
jgi:hypothetical protein